MNDHNKLSEETTVSRMAFDEMFKCADDYWNQLLETRKKNQEMQTFLNEKVKTIMELEKKLSGQSIVEEVPPGIIKFSNNSMTYTRGDVDYNEWVKIHLSEGDIIHSISVEGVVWEVGEEVANKYKGGYIIQSFKYDYDQWYAYYKNGRGCDRISSLLKCPPERKIVGWSIKNNNIEVPFFIKPEEMPEVFEPIYEEPRTPVVELPESLLKEAVQRLNYYKDVYLNNSPTIYGQVQYLVNQLNKILNPNQ